MLHPEAKAMYPKSAALGLKFVSPGKDVDVAGFDEDDVKKALGATRFNLLLGGVTHMFNIGHRQREDGIHPNAFYAHDVEDFLAKEK